jgi:hypothetical protein
LDCCQRVSRREVRQQCAIAHEQRARELQPGTAPPLGRLAHLGLRVPRVVEAQHAAGLDASRRQRAADEVGAGAQQGGGDRGLGGLPVAAVLWCSTAQSIAEWRSAKRGRGVGMPGAARAPVALGGAEQHARRGEALQHLRVQGGTCCRCGLLQAGACEGGGGAHAGNTQADQQAAAPTCSAHSTSVTVLPVPGGPKRT